MYWYFTLYLPHMAIPSLSNKPPSLTCCSLPIVHLLFSPLFNHITSMVKTSRSHPSSPPPPQAKVTNCHRSPSARYKAGYASSPPMRARPGKKGPKILLSLRTKMLMTLLMISANAHLRRKIRVPTKIQLSFLTNTMLLSLLISKNAPLRTISWQWSSCR